MTGSASFWSGSVVYLTNVQAELDGEPCVAQSYDEDKGQWLLHLLHPRFNGRAVHILEKNLTFGYCVLPDSCGAGDGNPAGLCQKGAQGTSSCGLAVEQACIAGAVLLEEQPFVVTADDTNEMCRAVLKLRDEAAHDEAKAGAWAAFLHLPSGGLPPGARQRCWAAADRAMQAAMGGTPEAAKASDEVREEVAALSEHLLRFEAHRFRTPLGARCGADAHAVFRQLSQLGHSCRPTTTVQWETAQDAESHGPAGGANGRLVLRALRELQPGEGLSINVGPAELLEWAVSKRRASLWRQKGFMCQCTRCVEEGGVCTKMMGGASRQAAPDLLGEP